MTEELLKRLTEQYGDPDTGGYEYVNPDGPEAAALIRQLKADNERMREALEPSGDTKAAYMGEFKFPLCIGGDEDGDEIWHDQYVPWDVIKQIMSAIRARAAQSLNQTERGEG